ncbi:MAG: YccF domain-containing protein [Candidatus Nanopelagicales bacterium]
MELLRFIGNIIWLILTGWLIALGFAVAGVIMFIFIVTIPWAIASFRLANFALWPFGRTTVSNPEAGVPSLIGNVLWMVFAGIWIALALVTYGIGLCVTIIGIPWGVQAFKMVPLALFPLGQQIVPISTLAAPMARTTY